MVGRLPMFMANVVTGASESGAPSAAMPRNFPEAGSRSPDTSYGCLLSDGLLALLLDAGWPPGPAALGDDNATQPARTAASTAPAISWAGARPVTPQAQLSARAVYGRHTRTGKRRARRLESGRCG